MPTVVGQASKLVCGFRKVYTCILSADTGCRHGVLFGTRTSLTLFGLTYHVRRYHHRSGSCWTSSGNGTFAGSPSTPHYFDPEFVQKSGSRGNAYISDSLWHPAFGVCEASEGTVEWIW